MRVLYYFSNLSPKAGGVYHYALALLKVLSKAGQDKVEYFVYAHNVDAELKSVAASSANITILNIEQGFLRKLKRVAATFTRIFAPRNFLTFTVVDDLIETRFGHVLGEECFLNLRLIMLMLLL